MKRYPRKSKPFRETGHYYFTEYGTSPVSLSLAIIEESNISPKKDVKHCHKKGYEFYLTIMGEAILEVEGTDVTLNKKEVIMVEPGEKHFVKKVTKTPFSVVVINTVNKKEDKVVF